MKSKHQDATRSWDCHPGLPNFLHGNAGGCYLGAPMAHGVWNLTAVQSKSNAAITVLP